MCQRQQTSTPPFSMQWGKGVGGIGVIFLILCLAACTPTPMLTPTIAFATCMGFVILNDAPHQCQQTDNQAIIASEAEQITLEGFGASIVVRGQIQLERSENSFIVRVIEGSAVVGAKGRSRILASGNTVEIPLLDGIAQAPNELLSSAADTVPMAMEAESTAALLQAEPTATFEGDCTVREDWGQTYTVQAGDVLSEIAESYGLTIEEIAQANCLTDPSRLRIGQVLRIAGETPTATPSAIAFRADSYSLTAGQCTSLRWDVFNVAEVYLDEVATELNSFLEVCPEATTTYTLRVVFLDGSETERELVISVEES